MENLVFQAAQEGDVISLLSILQKDPLILDKIFVNCFPETPLHVASMLGHVDFVREIVSRKPEFAREMNSQKSLPLHLASAGGFVDVVKVLISVDSDMCLATDKDGRNPSHLAAIKGRIDVLQEILQAKPDAAKATMCGGDTILHTCVMYNQLDALKFVVNMMNDKNFLNTKNDDGNTILHMAVADKQTETINYLLFDTNIEINIGNLYELTAMDVLIQSRRDVKDMDIRESLNRAGVISTKDSVQHGTKVTRTKHMNDYIKQQQDWLASKRDTLMIVASLIATMAYQAVMNAPGGFYQDDKQDGDGVLVHYAGLSILSQYQGYSTLLIFNTISFMASLSSILLLISGLPLRHRIYVWILMVIMWIAITSIAITYAGVILMTTVDNHDSESDKVFENNAVCILLGWMILMCLLLLGHSVRIIVKIVKALSKFIRRKKLEFTNYRNVNIPLI